MLWVGLVGGPGGSHGGMGSGDGPDVGGAGLMDGLHGGNGGDIYQQQQGMRGASTLPCLRSYHTSGTTDSLLRALLISLLNLRTSLSCFKQFQ